MWQNCQNNRFTSQYPVVKKFNYHLSIPLQMAPASKIPAPLLVGGAPKKDPKGGPKKKASYASISTEFGDKKGRKVRKVLRPKAASVTASGGGGTTRTPSKRQGGGHVQ